MLPLLILYQLMRCLLGLIAVLVRQDLSKDAELLALRHQNAVLHRQISHVRYTPADRAWLATLSRLLPRHRWAEIFPVTPATIRAWHRQLVSRKWDSTARRQPGRPPTAAAIKNLVVRMATENPTGGISALAGRTGPARPSHRRLHGGRFCTTLALIPPHVDRVQPGASSLPPRPRPSSPWTSCPWTPSCSGGSMS
jgi:hypothetical protein